MSNVAQAAREWLAAGVSTIPILPNGTKKPAFKWAEWQQHLPGPGEVDQWWANGQEYGLALIMGKVSGNLEMLELEARVCTPEFLLRIEAAAERLGVLDKWYRLQEEGYMEESPSGGLHWIYRIHDHDVPGNEKVARRPATAEELDENPTDKIKVLAETRGEGGYVIVAPTSGLCHPSGYRWTKLHGEYGNVVTLLWETRCKIHQAIREALDEPIESNLPVPAVAASPGTLVGTGHLWDEYDRTADFPTLLRERGWTPTRNGREWTRPGKDPRDGTSATLDHDGTNRLFVFSTASGLDTDRYFSPFEFVAYSDYGGDIKRALADLHIVAPKASIQDFTYVAELIPEHEVFYSLTDTGNAQRLAAADSVRGLFHYVHETKQFLQWSGTHWTVDHDGALVREFQKIAERMSDSDNEAVAKWGKNSLAQARIQAAITLFRSIQGVTKSTQDFDQDRELLNVANGTLNLVTGELRPHDAKDRVTRMFGASYDPHAKCPNWTAFIERTIPDPKMRAYVQRACGYSLLGNADQRSLFVLHGPSGTGKSTFLETLRAVFADYGTTAPTGAFKARRNEVSPTNDLHGLRGKRFVVTSETSEQAAFDEELLKRLTGRDSIQSRELFQTNQEWVPECVLWIATNHAPKFNSDDDAVWRRLKLIPFPQPVEQFEEIPDMAHRVLVPEADGILNWLVAGLKSFQVNGLKEPTEVSEASTLVRRSGDSVARFVEDYLTEGRLTLQAGEVTNQTVLMKMYQTWCRDNMERPLGSRRVMNRLSSMYPEIVLSHDGRSWLGLGVRVRLGIAGTIFD